MTRSFSNEDRRTALAATYPDFSQKGPLAHVQILSVFVFDFLPGTDTHSIALGGSFSQLKYSVPLWKDASGVTVIRHVRIPNPVL